MAGSDLGAIKQQFGTRPFRVMEAVEAGIARHAVYRLRDEGALLMLSRGVMQSIDSDPATNTEFAALAARVPKGTICLNSGLSYWEPRTASPRRPSIWNASREAPGRGSRSGSTPLSAASSTRCPRSTLR